MLDNKEYEDAYILLNGLNYKDSEELATQCFETIMAERISVSEDGLSITFGCYEQDGDTENGAEKITWQILAKEGDRFLVISTYGLDSVPYNTKSRFATWETCSLRNWLNYKFINTAFTPAEQAMILTTKAIADKNPDYGTDPGNDTEDKIFLLSIPEIQTYFRSDSERTVTATVYAKNQGADVSDIGNSWWWLRSPGDSTRNAVNVGSDGSVNASGRPVGSTHSVVRPAFWVRISNQ